MSIMKKITRERIEIWINNVVALVYALLAYAALIMVILSSMIVISHVLLM